MAKNGEKGEKRKAEETSSQSINSENSSRDQGRSVTDQHAVSFLLNETNTVLYGTTNEHYCNENAEHVPYASTPLSSGIAGSGSTTSTNAQFAEIRNMFGTIMRKLQKLDVIEERMNSLDNRMGSLESRIVVTEQKGIEFQKSVKFVSGKCDEFQLKSNEITALSRTIEKQRKDICDLNDNIERQKKELDKISRKMADAGEKEKELEDKVLDLRCRSMKYNLVFTGVDGETREENTEERLRDFIYYNLEIDRDMEFCSVHRFGRFVSGKCRPIVARFVYVAGNKCN